MTEELSGARQKGLPAMHSDKAGRYCTFKLANEEYAVEILKVQEIIGRMGTTYVPKTPDFVRGVINLRGRIIPVVDLKVRFGMEATEDTERTCIVVVQVAGADRDMTMGILVDDVPEVLGIGAEEIGPAPEFGADVDVAYLLGVGRVQERVILLLDIDRVLSSGEMKLVERTSQPDDHPPVAVEVGG